MSNHLHLVLQGPELDALGRPLRWFMTQTAKTFHRLRGRRGHFWERRYRACLVEDDRYALAALRYLDRNPVRAGLVDDPTTYPWSSCAAYALGAPNRQITFHPSYLALSPYPKVRQRHYHTLLLPNPDPRLDESAGRGKHRIPDPPSSPPRETTKRSRTSAHSTTWGLKGVRYFFTCQARRGYQAGTW